MADSLGQPSEAALMPLNDITQLCLAVPDGDGRGRQGTRPRAASAVVKLLLVGLIEPVEDIRLRMLLTLTSQGRKRMQERGGSSQGVEWGLFAL